MHTNECNKFEISRDGKSVNSCFIAEMCIMSVREPECIEFYDDNAKTATLFPESGELCSLDEAADGKEKPWPKDCKVF